MAKPITHIEKKMLDRQQEQHQSLLQLRAGLADNREALVALLDIVKELQAAGILDLLQGILKNRHALGSIALSQLNQPAAHHVIKNGIGMLQFLGRLDPGQLQALLSAFAAGLQRAGEAKNQPLGIWGLGKALRDPDVAVSVQSMLEFLRGMGKALQNSREGRR